MLFDCMCDECLLLEEGSVVFGKLVVYDDWLFDVYVVLDFGCYC